VAIRDAVQQIPSRVAPQFGDPQHAEAIIQRECEIALRTFERQWQLMPQSFSAGALAEIAQPLRENSPRAGRQHSL